MYCRLDCNTQGLELSRLEVIVLQAYASQPSIVPRVSFVPAWYKLLSCLRSSSSSSYLEPVGDIRIETADLSNTVVKNINGLAGLKSGLRSSISSCALAHGFLLFIVVVRASRAGAAL